MKKTKNLMFIVILTMIINSCSKKSEVQPTKANAEQLPTDSANNPVLPDTTVSDIDGNVYKAIVIANQVWMKENLKVKHYNNGDPINYVPGIGWGNMTTGAYSAFYSIANYEDTYGFLYNFYATIDNRNLCPSGWHVPSNAEWNTVSDNLGGSDIAGGKMKETDTLHWKSPNTGATNSSGFTGLPGGYRYPSTTCFIYAGYLRQGTWWSSSAVDSINAYNRTLYFGSTTIITSNNTDKKCGTSVRCVHD
jgi:uncharacterized protein (TIGR02145 family)